MTGLTSALVLALIATALPATSAVAARSVTPTITQSWAGMEASGTREFNDVYGGFTVPTFQCDRKGKENSAVALWVGLGGDPGEELLLQDGVTVGCDNGKPFYDPFWDLFPNKSVTLKDDNGKKLAVSSGDEMSAFVVWQYPTQHYVLEVDDYNPTTRAYWHWEYTQPNLRQKFLSAECIVERTPSTAGGLWPLTHFADINSDSCSGGTGTTVDDSRTYVLLPKTKIPSAKVKVDTIYTKAGRGSHFLTTVAYPYAHDIPGGEGFTVHWLHST